MKFVTSYFEGMRGSRNFCQWGGGGGGGVHTQRSENSLDKVFFVFFLVLKVYRGGPTVLLRRKLYFSKDPEGVKHFPGGGGGPNANFYRNQYNL